MYVITNLDEFTERLPETGEFILLPERVFGNYKMLSALAYVEEVKQSMSKIDNSIELVGYALPLDGSDFPVRFDVNEVIFMSDLGASKLINSENPELTREVFKMSLPEEIVLKYEKGEKELQEQVEQRTKEVISVISNNDNSWRFTINGNTKSVTGVAKKQGNSLRVVFDGENLPYKQFMWVRNQLMKKLDKELSTAN